MAEVSTMSVFFIGLSVAYYAISAYQLFGITNRSKLQGMLMWVMLFWRVSTLKDLLLFLPGFENGDMLRHIYFFDGYGAATVAVLLMEITKPGWTTALRYNMMSLPFIFFFVLHFFIHESWFDTFYTCFFWTYALAAMFIGLLRGISYTRYIRNNLSTIDEVEISWLWHIAIVFTVCQLVWYAVSDTLNPITDAIYYTLAIYCWHVVKTRVNRMNTLLLPLPQEMSEKVDNEESIPEYPFAGKLEDIVETEALYLNIDLSLSDLVNRLNTNRTYVSRYFNDVLGTTFYDYINKLRIERAAIPLLKEGNIYTLEYIAQESGFKSISTFRRAFRKFTGHSASDYRRQVTDNQQKHIIN